MKNSAVADTVQAQLCRLIQKMHATTRTIVRVLLISRVNPSSAGEKNPGLGPGCRGLLPPSQRAGRNSAFNWSKRSEEHTSELQSPCNLVCRLLLEKKTYMLSAGIFQIPEGIGSAIWVPKNTAQLGMLILSLSALV